MSLRTARVLLSEPILRVIGYAVALWIITLVVGGSLIASGWGIGNIWVVALLATAAALSEQASVRLSASADIEESISLLFCLVGAVLYGPLAAMAIAAASMLGDLWNDGPQPRLKWAVYTATKSFSGALTGLVAMEAPSPHTNALGNLVVATALAAVTAEALDVFFSALTFRVRGSGRMADVVRTLAPTFIGSVPLSSPVVALLLFGVRAVSIWALPLFLAPALVAQRLFVLYQKQRHLTAELVSVNARLEGANLSFASALVATLDARDHYTAGHSAAVARYAQDIAARMGLCEEEQRRAELCGLVHDIGKIGLAAGLLEKTGALTLEERRQMEQHSVIGQRILERVDTYADVARVVRSHHERVDGAGYPDGLVGDEIPLLARILAVADAYNAMTSDRPYRQAMPSAVARMRLARAVESQFDTSVVAAFEAILARATEAYRMGHGEGFTLDIREEMDDVSSWSLGEFRAREAVVQS